MVGRIRRQGRRYRYAWRTADLTFFETQVKLITGKNWKVDTQTRKIDTHVKPFLSIIVL